MGAALGSGIRSERGFTLVELVVAMPIMLIVMGGLTLMLTTLSSKSSQQQETTILQTEARSALDRMEMEIRGAFTGDGSPQIVSAGPNSITFYSPDQYATTVVGSTQSSFHLREISYQVTSTGLLQRQFMTSTNTFPTASCLTCGGTSQWTWPGGGMSAWTTVVGSSGAIINASNTCKPATATAVPGVFCYYQNTDLLNTLQNPQTTGAWADNWLPQTFTGSPLLVTNTAALSSVVVTLELSSGGSQPVKFLVSDAMTMRGTS
jgi:prepilin-type N-terminal cleavage/methylation domain-containing protein